MPSPTTERITAPGPLAVRQDEGVGDDVTLGLVLGGGGAFGAAHVGVLRVLAERGIRPGIVTGTSSGALVAAAYAASLEQAAIERAARTFRWRAIARWSFAPRWGLLDSVAMREAVIRVLGTDPLIEDLPRRFAAFATDLRTRRGVIIDEGPLSAALRASIAVPGVLPPVRRGGALLADGGMVDNVPVAAARALGASRVIVVRLHARWENVRMMRTVTRTADLARDPSVVLIQPEMEGMAQWTMSDVPRLIAEGRRAAVTALNAHGTRLRHADGTEAEPAIG
jgi:NTE family protein